jgi:hypothetical protein
MRSRTAFVSLSVIVLALAGCGSTNKAATTAVTSSSLPSRAAETPQPVKPVTFRVKLGANGTPAGAPSGSGLAVITIDIFHGQLCWKFSQVKNVTAPTQARVFRSFPGDPGLPLGRAYRPSGCVLEPRVLLELLGAHPHGFYVGIDSTQFRAGAVRGRL